MDDLTPRFIPQRTPAAAAPHARIQPLATLPVFFRARDRIVLVVGESEAVAWKAELLLAAGAHVHCLAPMPCSALELLAKDQEHLTLLRRPWSDTDFDGVLLALCDANDDDEAARFHASGRRAGVPVNVIDRPRFCDFQFGSVVNRSPLVVAISTDGAAPVFGQALRTRIEALLPAGFAAWARAAQSWRTQLRARGLPFRARRRFWEAFTARALAEPARAPAPHDLAALLEKVEEREPQTGKVLLVGAGPGDPELLTLRAVRVLQSADVILYDDLVAPGILDLARREAERINVGKRGYKPSCGQDEISAMLVSLAKAGRVVARLKGGDPLIFGRANEEIAALRGAGVPVEVVPGVTAASGAAAAIGTSLTERDLARRLQFVTAHARDGRLPDDLDWRALADPKATTAVYMGVRTLPALVDRLLENGMVATTPIVMVERASWPDERVIASSLGAIVDRLASSSVHGPSLFLIGWALKGISANAGDADATVSEATSSRG